MESTLGEHDKVVALTEGMLNQGLSKMHNIYKLLESFDYNEKEFVAINIDLQSPRISIKADGQVFYEFRIKSGTIEAPTLGVPLTNVRSWIISHLFNIGVLLESSEENDTFGTRGVNGDWSIERFFATITSTANDGFNIHPVQSKCLKDALYDPTEINWEDWAKMPETKAFATIISQNVFKEWPKKLRDRKYNATGFRYGLVEAPRTSVAETRQLLIYRKLSGVKVADHEKESSYNSILICSPKSSEGEKGTFTDAKFSSNFVKEVKPGSETAVTHGLWSLNYRVVLENYILPRIRCFVQASQVVAKGRVWFDDEFEPMFDLLYDFTKGDHDSPAELSTCNFIREFDKESGKVGYTWKGSCVAIQSVVKDAAGRIGDTNEYSCSSSSRCIVSWMYPGNIIEVNIRTDTPVVSKWSGTKAGLYQYTCRMNYSLKLEITFEDNALKVGVLNIVNINKKPGEIDVEVIGQIADGAYAFWETQHTLIFKEFKEKRLEPSLKLARDKVKESCGVIAKLPEAEWFDFGTPVLNLSGDIVAAIEYKSPRWRDIIFQAPPLQAPQRDPTPPPPEPPKEKTTKLTWTQTTKFSADRTRLEVCVTGTNDTSNKISFAFIEICFSSKKGEPALFSALKFWDQPDRADKISVLHVPFQELVIQKITKSILTKATVNEFSLKVGEKISIRIEGPTGSKPGVYPVDILEARKGMLSGKLEKEGKDSLDVVLS